ncbi:MAG: tetratricopeptide repeat protein [Candidatus Rifleibacteriota bacterium]
METKKQQSNFWSKLVETDLRALLFATVNSRSFIVIAVCFLLLAFSTQNIEGAINSGNIYQLQQRLIDKPRDTEAMLHLAMEYSLKNNFVKAVETYFNLLRIDPDNFHAYNNLGILYKKSGQFRDSLHCYRQAERINPDSYWVPYNMGLCYEAMGRMQEARESYGKALSLNPGFTQALHRLRSLTDTGSSETVPSLPGLEESMVYIVEGQKSQPGIYNPNEEAAKPEKSTKPVVKSKPDKIELQKPAKVSEIIEKRKEKEKKKAKVRTDRKGPAAAIFNQAMAALEKNNMKRAIELYCRAIIAERELLSEPENNLIKKALLFLQDRPNRMTDGLFFRGFFISVSGNFELAIPDLKAYIEQGDPEKKDEVFLQEAKRMVERYENMVARQEALQEKQSAEIAAARERARQAATAEPDKPRASDFVVKNMSVEEILSEADRLNRSGKHKEAVAVLKVGLESEPDNIKMLMKSANAYTDLLITKGDKDAGQMALMQFEKVYERAPENSREWAVAQEMIEELQRRLN